jgi:gamma-glutamyltranspeptidase/glutathione hydrolase
MQDALSILRQGGNAIDAAMSMAMAQVVYAVGTWTSFAGLMTLVYYNAGTGQMYSMDAGYKTVKSETDPLSIPMSSLLDPSQPDYPTSGRIALVPGFFAGVEAAHQKLGKLPFAKLFDSAIGLAESGFRVTPGFVSFVEANRSHLSRVPETRGIFFKPDGSMYEIGDAFHQPLLAQTLRKIASLGTSYVYRGQWAKEYIAGIQADGGKMSMSDLADYEVEWKEPIKINYRGFDICAHHQAHFMLGMLGLAQAANLSSLGRYYESAEAFYWYHKIFRATGTNMAMMGDRINQLHVSAEDWLDTKKIATYWSQIRDGVFPYTRRDAAEPHTDSTVIVDQSGNVVSITHSTNSGGTGRYVGGISTPGPAASQQQHIAKVGPGKRLPNFIPNTIILKEGRPFMATAATGMALHQETVKVITNVIDYGKAGREAVQAPSFVEPHYSAAGADPNEIVLRGDYTQELLNAVRAKGMSVEERVSEFQCICGDNKPTKFLGTSAVVPIVIDQRNKEYEGVSSRFIGDAMGF